MWGCRGRIVVEIGKVLPAGGDGQGARYVSPTDIAQFIRLEQCERYLRLRLYQRAGNYRFMEEYGVAPQSIPPLLTRSGADFEERVEKAVAQRFWTIHFVDDLAHAGQRPEDNERVVHLARDLAPEEIVVLFQPRLLVKLGGWLVRGDVDILRLERDADGSLGVLIADIKSSTSARVEHRLQVAFYGEMLTALFAEKGVPHMPVEMGILYRGPADPDGDVSGEEAARREAQRQAAGASFGTCEGLLEIVPDPDSYRGAVWDLVTGPQSTASRVAEADFEDIPYHLTYKCDGCMFNELCMKWSAERDDLSLLPHLTPEDKNALRRNGVGTVQQLATLKDLQRAGKAQTPPYWSDLVPAPGKEALVRRLAATWPVGPRLDELVHRARRYRQWKGDTIEAQSRIPSKGYGSLPYTAPEHNPNLVRVYVDAQHDYLHDRIYMLGALVVGCEGGEESPTRRRSIVHLTEGPPETAACEEALFLRWIRDTMRAIVEVAAPDENGEPRAPLHLIFFNRFEQQLLLDGLARHFTSILEATPLYDFVTQMAAFDSPIATFLDGEIRELKNYPMVCQSLQAVAAYLRFDWNAPAPYRQIFRTRMFDFWGRLDRDEASGQETPWYTNRARFNSQIPLEYAYAAWRELPEPLARGNDDFASYRAATPELLSGFHARRLEALEWITRDFDGNRQTEKRTFELPGLDQFDGKAQSLAQALDEFVTVERHVALAAWKTIHLAPPERRVLMGETLIVRYHDVDQDPETAERNRENARRRALRERYVSEWRAANPPAPRVQLPKAQKDECVWTQEGMRFRLRLECAGVDCDLDEMLGLTSFREGDSLVLFERTTVDSRLPAADQKPFTPTPKQLLYGMRVSLAGIQVERDAEGHAVCAAVEVEMKGPRGSADRGFAFATMNERPLLDGECYTLDIDPNDWYGSWCAKVTEGLCGLEESSPGGNNALYDRLAARRSGSSDWPREAMEGQRRFRDGLDALGAAGAFHAFEESKRDYIGRHGDAPTLLVQGPPGTGKSYSTAFALFARLQGALAADRDFRVFVSCKTHAATDVLLHNIVRVQDLLRHLAGTHPDIFRRYFDARLLTIPLFRMAPRGSVPAGVTPLRRKDERAPGEPLAMDAIAAQRRAIVATTPGGTYRLTKDRWEKALFGHTVCHCLVLDEASQMNLPEAIMAALPLEETGQLIVVGDHRQMPPIVKHDWASEPRRTFAEFRSYESLFLALLPLNPPMIKFAESFRLHADMAEFLRREIYQQDGISYFSRRRETLPSGEHLDPFVAGVLQPRYPIVVVVHDEAGSLLRNPFEQALIAPVLEALAAGPYRLDPERGLGVVVPHRAQRAALQEAVPVLNVIDPHTGAIVRSAVDTVERFQGDERTAILVGATESDREYLLVSGEFLLDPRRLTVALSRARAKMVLVASRSVFSLISADEETFANSQLWKNLLRATCTVKLWEGERDGRQVQVWGNEPAPRMHPLEATT